MFNVIVPPEKFSLDRHSDDDKAKLRDYILDKIRTCENSLTKFYGEYNEHAEAWRVRKSKSGNPKTLFNSRTGETHRAVEALCTFWFRALTASDPYIEAVAEGLDPFGKPLSSGDLYAIERIIMKQNEFVNFKAKFLTALRSAGLFGTAIVEEPFMQCPVSGSRKYIEATDFVLSPMIRTFFDTNVPYIKMSDFMANVDFLTKNKILSLSYNDTETWDVGAVKNALENNSGSAIKRDTTALERIRTRKNRGGYSDIDGDLHELINFHGRLSKECIELGLIQELWKFEGDDQDPNTVDWTIRLLDSGTVASAYITQYGDWRTRFKDLTMRQFELEPIGYGVGPIGRKIQGEMDFITSNANNHSTLSTYGMWLVNRTAGVNMNQLGMEPNVMIEVEDVQNSIAPLRTDPNATLYAMNLAQALRTDFRGLNGGETLQAILTKASATESSIAQNEAVRQQSVNAEIIGESFREHIDTMHLNNINHLDSEIWIAMGEDNPEMHSYNKNNIPTNVGFRVKITTDKDYRPERQKNLYTALQLYSSIRQMLPTELSINAIRHLSKEAFRGLGLDPRKLFDAVPMKDQLEMNMRKNQQLNNASGPGGGMDNEISGEMAGEEAGTANISNTPVGPVAMSPNQSNLLEGSI